MCLVIAPALLLPSKLHYIYFNFFYMFMYLYKRELKLIQLRKFINLNYLYRYILL